MIIDHTNNSSCLSVLILLYIATNLAATVFSHSVNRTRLFFVTRWVQQSAVNQLNDVVPYSISSTKHGLHNL